MVETKNAGRSESHTPLISRVQEPLTLIALAVFFLTCFRVIIGPGTLYSIIPLITLVLGVLSVYFTHIYLKGKEKRYALLGVPALIFVVTLFSYYSSVYPKSGLERDYTVFSIIAGISLFSYILLINKILKFDVAVSLALFFSTLILHMIPAYAPLISNLDSYFQYKWAEAVYETGFLPDHDYFTYPLHNGIERNRGEEPGLDISTASFFVPIFLGYTASITKAFGIGIYEVAILYPGVFPALTVVVLYLLVSELFSERAPYNKIAAFLAAFVLMMSPAYATNGTAGNPEDDAFGMFLVVTSLLFFVAAYKRESMKFLYIAMFSFFVLRISWGGYAYILVVCGIFGVFYSIARFARNESCFSHITYMLGSILPSFLAPLIVLHPRGSLPPLIAFTYPPSGITALVGASFVAIFLEYIRQKKKSDKTPSNSENPIAQLNLWVQKNIKSLFAVMVMLMFIGLYFVGGSAVKVVGDTLGGRKANDVIKKTIAEQNPVATSPGEYLAVGPNKFSVLFLYAFIMIPVLLYVSFSKADFGSSFVLCWSLPMLYGVYFKSQYLFNASVPITVLGSTVGLYSIAKKEDLESLRVVGTLLVLIVPFISIPFFGAKYYNQAIAMVPMYMMPAGDIYYWQPALEWLRSSTKPDEAVLTWWDYGHWITSVSNRPVLIDNLQADPYQIQDVARFFVNKTTEEEAFEIVKAYAKKYREVKNIFSEGVDLRYVVIDWTMIGKGSALHFIATGDIEKNTDGSFKNYMQCGFIPQASDRTPRVMTDENGSMFLGKKIIFGCGGPFILGVEFLIKEDKELSSVNVILNQGQRIPWSSWVEHNDASLLGVQPLSQILSLAIVRPDDQILPQFRTLVYVPEEFSDFMMTRIYLSDHLNTVFDERFCGLPENKNSLGCVTYINQGLSNREYKPLKYFKFINDFSSGFVRAYEITYPEEMGE